MRSRRAPRRAGGLPFRLAAALAACCACGHAMAQADEAPRFAPRVEEAGTGSVLARPALLPPARYRVLIVPGTGCRSLAPSADRLAAGLMHAEVFILQKPHLRSPDADADADADAGVDAGAVECSTDFLRADRLSAWLERARRLAGLVLAQGDAGLPLVLAGLSEGAELLPGLAASLPQARLLVMVGHAGLDPAEAGALQAQRLGQAGRWSALLRDAACPLGAADATGELAEGRHPCYWTDLRGWRLRQPLLDDPRPLLHAWGGRDALMPPAAHAAFAAQARDRAGGYCALRLDWADHELRSPQRDGLQAVWAWLEGLARQGWRWPAPCPPQA